MAELERDDGFGNSRQAKRLSRVTQGGGTHWVDVEEGKKTN